MRKFQCFRFSFLLILLHLHHAKGKTIRNEDCFCFPKSETKYANYSVSEKPKWKTAAKYKGTRLKRKSL